MGACAARAPTPAKIAGTGKATQGNSGWVLSRLLGLRLGVRYDGVQHATSELLGVLLLA
jgi:hypothetical protein